MVIEKLINNQRVNADTKYEWAGNMQPTTNSRNAKNSLDQKEGHSLTVKSRQIDLYSPEDNIKDNKNVNIQNIINNPTLLAKINQPNPFNDFSKSQIGEICRASGDLIENP